MDIRLGSRTIARAIAAIGVVGLLLAPPPAVVPSVGAVPQTFTVNSAGDPGTGVCDGTECTLREAIVAANANAGADTIEFEIPGAGVQTIAPTAALPDVTDSVTIDGYTQDGASENTAEKGTNAVLLIELSGASAPFNTPGLRVTGGSATIRGLVINGFNSPARDGIFLGVGTSDNVVEGNFVGTDPTGTLDQGNDSGVNVAGPNSRVGGPTVASRNLISGNGTGLRLGAANATVENNLIGTDSTGKRNLGSQGIGIAITGQDNTIARNIVAFSDFQGIIVLFAAAAGNTFRENALFKNSELGIDLNLDGITLNDGGTPPDADAGPNGLQNFPAITSAKTTKKTTIKGKLVSTPNTSFTVEFFANPKGGKPGQTPLGTAVVTTDGDGNATFTFKPARKVRTGNTVTATATNDATGDTSEFSKPRKVA